MVDTRRSLSELLTTMFQDGQGEGSITAQDMRDLIISMAPSHGAMILATPAATTIGTPGTYVKAAGATGAPAGDPGLNFSHPISNRLRYDDTVPIHAYVTGSLSMTAAGANKEVGVKVAKNGVVLDESLITRTLGATGDKAALSIHVGVSMVSMDYLELWLTNLDDTTSVTVETMYFHVNGLIV